MLFIFSTKLNKFDVFMGQKQKSLMDSTQPTLTLLNYLMTVVNDLDSGEISDKEKLFKQLMQVNLVGRCLDCQIFQELFLYK